MSISHAFFGSSRLVVPLALLSGCIGGRTALTDAATTIGNGSDSVEAATIGDGSDSVEAASIGDGSDPVEAACGSTMTISTKPVQADILILLDRSESMTWTLDTDDVCTADITKCSSRADAVVPAVASIVTDNPDINWGLELFPYPDEPTCSVSTTPQVAVSSNSASAIKSQLASFTTSPSTPTAAAIHAATTYLKTVNDTRNKAILLATDGYPTCGNNSNVDQMVKDATDAAATAQNAGFPVYVIGIGQEVSKLNRLAKAGGTGSYYPATSTTELNNALKSIAKVFSQTCTFRASTIPPDKDLATVLVDNKLVAKDDSNGWMFDPADATDSTILLTGSYCQSMLAGANSQVQIVFGCPKN
jgi:hypothetical protein